MLDPDTGGPSALDPSGGGGVVADRGDELAGLAQPSKCLGDVAGDSAGLPRDAGGVALVEVGLPSTIIFESMVAPPRTTTG